MLKDDMIKILMEKNQSLKISHLKKKLKKELEDMMTNEITIINMTDDSIVSGATFSIDLINNFNGERGYWTKIIELLLLDGILTKDEIEEVYKLDKINRRIGILSIIERDAAKMERIYKIMNTRKEQGTNINIIKSLITMLRAYVKVADVDQKKYGEVMTPLEMVKEMIQVIPNDFWSNPNLKILDPSNGVGPFPSLVIFKLMNGLEEWEPDEEKRYKHIVENIIYVCELQPKNMFLWMCLVDPFDSYDINIYCGSFLDNDFDSYMKDVWNVEKFDLILTNPPYQESLNTKKGSAKPLYNLFTEKSVKISDLVLMITPSRWFAGGKGLGPFRKFMAGSNKIKLINHFDNACEIFGDNVEIKGGVSYFLYDNNYNGNCKLNGSETNLSNFDVLIQDNRFENLIERFENLESLSKICVGQSYAGITSNDSRLVDEKIDETYTKVFVSQQKGLIKWIKREDIKKSATIDGWKVYTARAAGSTGNLGKFGNKIIGEPNSVCTQSYIVFNISSKKEAESCKSYLETKFANKMLSLRKVSQDIKPDTLKWIPLVPFDRDWTDDLLFEYFDLTISERKLILE